MVFYLGAMLIYLQFDREARVQFEEALRIMPDYQPAKQKLSLMESLPRRAPR
jgi:hypothetical protein